MMKRTAAVYGLCILLLTGVMLRLCWIGWGNALQTGSAQGSLTLTVGQRRGGIYDRHLEPLVDRCSSRVTAVVPSPETLGALEGLAGEERSRLLRQMEEGRPFVTSVPLAGGAGVFGFTLPQRYGQEALAPHVIGYLDSGGRGVTGVEAACNGLLEQYGWSCGVSCPVDALGRALGGQACAFGQQQTPVGGVVLTLDAQLQRGVEEALALGGTAGAAVVMEADTGRLLAVASLPDYHPDRVEEALQQQDSPLINRAFSAYSVGSLFKLAVAAAALEAGIPADTVFQCSGSVEVEGRVFHCHHRAGHGEMDLQQALEHSCNVYFIRLAQRLGADALHSMALRLGFGSGSSLAEGMSSAAGTLAPREALTGGELANFAFGQGQLTATPLQLAVMISAIANGGNRLTPRLILGATDDGSNMDALAPVYAPTAVLQPQTARTLQEMMVAVVEQGSGGRAQPASGGAGGKTASAQTGRYDGQGREVVHAWFGGFYPAQDPRWTVVVLCEGGGSGGETAAPVFRRICAALADMEEAKGK